MILKVDEISKDHFQLHALLHFFFFLSAIFGQSLEETMAYEHKLNRKMPYIMEQCVNFLTENGLDVEGIFRFVV